WMPDGEMRVVSMRDRKLLRITSAGPAIVADLNGIATGNANDMVIDHSGRAYIGNFGFDLNGGAEPRPAALIRVDPDGTVSAAAEDLSFPNGCVITPDGKTMILAETFGHRITVFDIRPDGSLTNQRVLAELEGMYPDGICLDAERGVWVTVCENEKT